MGQTRGKRCVVGGCSTISGGDVPVHLFPKKTSLVHQWHRFVAATRKWPPSKEPPKVPVICGAHFNVSTCIKHNYKVTLHSTPRCSVECKVTFVVTNCLCLYVIRRYSV